MRRIVSLAGYNATFAVADDGTCWYWDGARWERARGPLPQPVTPTVIMATITSGEVAPHTPEPVRKPIGKGRKS